MPLDPDNSEVQCLASEVKTPDFKKAICGDDETESEEAFLLYDYYSHVRMKFSTYNKFL